MTNITTHAWLAVGIIGLTVTTYGFFSALASTAGTDV